MKWLKSGITGLDQDEENLIQDLKLEEEAIQIYQKHIELSPRQSVKDLLTHIMEEEKHHSEELKKQLKNIDITLTEEDKK
jgi:rubrerythrin